MDEFSARKLELASFLSGDNVNAIYIEEFKVKFHPSAHNYCRKRENLSTSYLFSQILFNMLEVVIRPIRRCRKSPKNFQASKEVTKKSKKFVPFVQ